MEDKIEFTDRYKALGIPYPDPETMCKGDCEGTGMVPIPSDNTDPVYRALADEIHIQSCLKEEIRYGTKCDGWHFVRCKKCMGTGKSKESVLLPSEEFIAGKGIDRKGTKADGLLWHWSWIRQCELMAMPEDDNRRLPCQACFAIFPKLTSGLARIQLYVHSWSETTNPKYSAEVEISGNTVLCNGRLKSRLQAQLSAEKLIENFCKATLKQIRKAKS